MRVYKFGGASVKDADGVKNLAAILRADDPKSLVLVVSAMGKMTNAFEELVGQVMARKDPMPSLNAIQLFHQNILTDLGLEASATQQSVAELFVQLEGKLDSTAVENYDFLYDQLVCYGELLSTTIVSGYLKSVGIQNDWKDVRKLVLTDSTYRDAQVDWEKTKQRMVTEIDRGSVSMVQGFLGGDHQGYTTTLGREGSDYTAGIVAYCLDATEVTIWKDVEGVLNADPRVFANTTLLERISYEETIEMAFYGASVIHPKTIQPLQSKDIPLRVKSFLNPSLPGTKVTRGVALQPLSPCYIVKKNQILLSIATKDFSFVVEDNISAIFKLLHTYQLKVSLIQNSAISFSVCVDNKFHHFDTFIEEIASLFRVSYAKGVDLYTIRHFNATSDAEILDKGTPLLTQITQETKQIVIQPKS